MSDKLIAFGYYGGKFSHLNWLLPLLPTRDITQYCEPFAGSGAVLLNRQPVNIETYNDIDGEVVNFFRVLRTQKDALIEQLMFTPVSRAEYIEAISAEPTTNELERARRFYIRARQTMLGLAQNATPGRWAYVINAASGGSVTSRWLNGIPKLAEIADRLLRVQIECLPALEIITRYDSPNTLFYVDPPYVMDTRNSGPEYANELTDSDHEKLLSTLKGCQAKIAISGYDSELYKDLLKDWHETKAEEKIAFSSPTRETRQEVLWTNYDPAAIHSVTDLPLFAQKPA